MHAVPPIITASPWLAPAGRRRANPALRASIEARGLSTMHRPGTSNNKPLWAMVPANRACRPTKRARAPTSAIGSRNIRTSGFAKARHANSAAEQDLWREFHEHWGSRLSRLSWFEALRFDEMHYSRKWGTSSCISIPTASLIPTSP